MRSKNLKLLIWFIIALGIALAPWIVLAQKKPLQKQKNNIDKTSVQRPYTPNLIVEVKLIAELP